MSFEQKTSKFESGLRLYRNYNALGALALAGAAIALPGSQPVIEGLAWINAAQAGGAEAWRQGLKKRRKRQLGKAALAQEG